MNVYLIYIYRHINIYYADAPNPTATYWFLVSIKY